MAWVFFAATPFGINRAASLLVLIAAIKLVEFSLETP